MEEPRPPVAVGPMGSTLRHPARGRPDHRLDSRVPPRARLCEYLRRGPGESVRAHEPCALCPHRPRGDQGRLGGPDSHAAPPAHGLLADRAAHERSADYAGAPEADGAASAELVARHGDRVAARTHNGEARPHSSATQLLADRRELVSRLGGRGRRRARPGPAGGLQSHHGRRPGGSQAGGPHVPLEAVRARENADRRVPRRTSRSPASRPGNPPARPAWVSERWSLSPRITRLGTSPASFHKSSRRTLVSRSWWWMTTPRTAPAGSPMRWPPKSPGCTSCTGRESSAWELLTSPGSSGLSNAATTACSKWTQTSPTIRHT